MTEAPLIVQIRLARIGRRAFFISHGEKLAKLTRDISYLTDYFSSYEISKRIFWLFARI
jgi:hypothetical protein